MQLLLIRHARPERVELAEGEVADPSLSGLGHAQARAVAEELAHEPIDAVYASSAARARQTAAPLAAVHDLAVIEREELLEYDFGSSSYIPIDEVAPDDPALAHWMAWFRPLEEDSEPDRYRRRVVAVSEEIVAAHPSQTVAVVSHGGTINAYLSGLLGVDRAMLFVPEYTAISRVHVSASGFWTLRTLNEHHHLQRVEDPAS